MSSKTSHRPAWVEAVTERASDPEWRRQATETATTKLGDLASEMVELASDIGEQISHKASDLGQSVADTVNEMEKPHKAKRERHTVRNLGLVGLVALAVYVVRRMARPTDGF